MKHSNFKKYPNITTSIYSSYIQMYIEKKYEKTFKRLSKWVQKDMDERMMPEIKGQFEIRVRPNLEAIKKVSV